MATKPKNHSVRSLAARAAAIFLIAAAAVSDKQAVAQRLVNQHDTGKLRFLAGYEDVYEREILVLAQTGSAPAGCDVDIRILQLLAMTVDNFSPLTVSDIGRTCVGTTINCPVSKHCLVPAAAIDFVAARGVNVTGALSNTGDLLRYLDTIVPANSRIGQVECRGPIALANMSTFEGDKCTHQHFDLFEATGNVKYDQASTPPAKPAVPGKQGNIAVPASASHVFFPGTGDNLANAFYANDKWNFGTIGSSIRSSSAIASDAAGDNVFFAAPSDSFYNAYYADGKWKASQIGGSVSPTGGIAVSADGKQAFFTGTDNNLWSAYYVNGEWKVGALGGNIRAGSPIISTEDGKRAFYIGADARLMNAYYADGAWKISAVGNIGVSANSGLATPDAGGTVYYTNSTGNLVNAYYSDGAWKTGVIGGSVRDNSPLSTTADGKTVVDIGTDNKIRNAYYANGGWQIGNLGGAPSDVSGLRITSDGQHIFYANTNQKLANLYYTTSGWRNGELGGNIRTN